jgi:hypothetical protein
MSEYVISSVMFSHDSIEIAFMVLPDDVRSDGQLVATRSYAIARSHPTHGEDVRDITESIVDLIEDVHRGFSNEPLTTVPDDEDDLEGMGSP